MSSAVLENSVEGVQVLGPPSDAIERILTPPALELIAELQRRFNPVRQELLLRRDEIQTQLDRGWLPDFPASTTHIRAGHWKVAPAPTDLQDRRVEITGPTDRKMIINALNSGASVYMADLEDSHAPTWEATIAGQANLIDAVAGRIEFTSPEGKQYRLNDRVATLMVRPRGWHLEERHLLVDGQPVSASLFDFALYLFHNASVLLAKGTGPYFYLPKLENRHEAALWNDVFIMTQDELGLPNGTIKATVLIETILAAFEMDEILYELRDHIVGLNCGRWDYIFSFIKKFRNQPEFVLPDRALVTMETHFLRSYSQKLIQSCHRRGAHAMGGMAAQIPIKNDPEANAAAMEKVRADKLREVNDGHDGTWVAHPGLVPIAMEIFNAKMPGANQLHVLRGDVNVSTGDLLKVSESRGQITDAGLRLNVNVAVRYLESWLRGIGCVPIFNLMEDAATAEISRAQVWQWIQHPTGVLADGTKITVPLVRQVLAEELEKIRQSVGDATYTSCKFEEAAALFDRITTAEQFIEFLTLAAYPMLS
jgi:malate synthase